jgi:hypothetical protein
MLRTQIPILQVPSDRLLFKDYIFRILLCDQYIREIDYFKFQNACNPFGILFHPLAIEKLIAFRRKKYLRKLIFFFIMSAGTVMMLILI